MEFVVGWPGVMRVVGGVERGRIEKLHMRLHSRNEEECSREERQHHEVGKIES
jgi:hypothetical protein